MTIFAIALAYAGFAALCLAMERHHGEVFGTRRIPPRRSIALRLSGWALLAVSFPTCIADWGWAFGSVAWCGVLTAAALPIVLLLPYRPRAMAALAPALPILGAVGACL